MTLTNEEKIRNSQTSIHFGVTYVMAGIFPTDHQKCVEFQQKLLGETLEFPDIHKDQREFVLTRKEPSPLQIRMISLGPQVLSLTICAERPQIDLDYFIREVNAACVAYHFVWYQNTPCQILRCHAVIRQLYSLDDHAFKYLWENRLGQKPTDFEHLGKRPVLGGGLRLVMPPLPINREPDPTQIEVKIESFFENLKQLFVETVFVWPIPKVLNVNQKFDPEYRLKKVEKYSADEVWNFIVNPKIGEER